MGRLTSLRTLNLRETRLKAGGVAELAPALARLSALRSLDLTATGLGDDSAPLLAPALGGLSALRNLRVGSNWGLGAGGHEAIEAAVNGSCCVR